MRFAADPMSAEAREAADMARALVTAFVWGDQEAFSELVTEAVRNYYDPERLAGLVSSLAALAVAMGEAGKAGVTTAELFVALDDAAFTF